jgi:hypothetical protein
MALGYDAQTSATQCPDDAPNSAMQDGNNRLGQIGVSGAGTSGTAASITHKFALSPAPSPMSVRRERPGQLTVFSEAAQAPVMDTFCQVQTAEKPENAG